MYAQITPDERYDIAAMRRRRMSIRAIARELGRSPSTISREVRRNLNSNGRYEASAACSYTRRRRSHSRRNSRFAEDDWALVEQLIARDWSPEQVSGWLKRHGLLSISHETIYLHVWHDKQDGGELYKHLRQATKRRRKRYGSRDSRGRLPGKRHISQRPPEVEGRQVMGHWEIDTIKGDSQATHSAVTLVERRSGYTVMGKLHRHTATECADRVIEMVMRHRVSTITADNGTEFHSYAEVEAATGALFYFATPHHSWERGTNENTNGLLRQYLPKRTSMAQLTQADLDAVAHLLNTRPRKRLGYRTPEECYAQS